MHRGVVRIEEPVGAVDSEDAGEVAVDDTTVADDCRAFAPMVRDNRLNAVSNPPMEHIARFVALPLP